MVDSSPNQSTKKRRTLKNVTVLCSRCKTAFQTKARAHLCPNCRPKLKQPAVNQNAPKPQRPPKPNRPNQQNRPQQQQQMQQLSNQMAALTNAVANPASRLANRTTNSASSLRPNRGARSAVDRLLLQVLDPAASCGQKPMRINVDQIQLPKYPIQFDNNFVVDCPTGDYKIMLIASPIISAVIYSNDGAITVRPGRVIRVGEGPFYYYVINSKLGFLSDLDVRLLLTPKEDFRRFRMISASMQAQWAGPEILKNGVSVTARLTDKENLADFDPNSKADNVIANVSDVLVSTCQHAEPVFDFLDVDGNNDDGSGSKPDPDKEAYATYNITFDSVDNPGNFDFVCGPIPITGAANNTNQYYIGKFIDGIASAYSSSSESVSAGRNIISSLSAKYRNFKCDPINGLNTTYSCSWAASIRMNPTTSSGKIVNTASGNNVTNDGVNDFFSALFAAIKLAVIDSTVAGAISTNIIGQIAITLRVPIDGAINQRVVIPTSMAPALASNEINETPFYDDTFLQPVTAMMGSGQMTMQYQTSHIFEFVLDDTTVLGTSTVASTPIDNENVVSKQQFTRFQKIMKGMPPGHILTDNGLSRTGVAQFTSRGIINDIFSLAAPIAGALFPGLKPVLNAAKPLVSVIDGAF